MEDFPAIYINPFTDYGFKRLFGEEPNKELLIDFLNELLKEEQGEIVNLTYLKSEFQGYTLTDRNAVFDIYCENEKGEKFLVEMQKTKQKFFKERTLYYSTFPIREQAQKADWDFNLKAVYVIAILDFVFDEDKDDSAKYLYNVKLADTQTNKVFYNKLSFIYLEMPKFNKDISEINTKFDKWLYVLKNLDRINRIPDKLREKIFEKLFEAAEIAKFSPIQLIDYEKSLNVYRDIKNSIDTSFEEGEAKGKIEGKIEGKNEEKRQTATLMLEENEPINKIIKFTGLSREAIEGLKK